MNLINDKIDEIDFIKKLITISESGFKIYHIDEIRKFIYYLEYKNFTNIYKFCFLLYYKDNLYRDICKFKQLSFINNIMVNKDIIFNHKIDMVYDKINSYKKIFISFKNFHFNILQTKPKKVCMTNKYEIINRLLLLLSYFSHDELKFMNIKLINIKSAKKMKLSKLHNYYYDIFTKIETFFDTINDTFSDYIKTNNDYKELYNLIINKKN